MAASQMNVRIDDALRITGNQVFKSIGLTPSRVVRSMWAFAARHQNNPSELKNALRFLEEDSDVNSAINQKRQLAEMGGHIVEDGLQRLHVRPPDTDSTSFDEMKERAYRELWKEKGLL